MVVKDVMVFELVEDLANPVILSLQLDGMGFCKLLLYTDNSELTSCTGSCIHMLLLCT